MIFYFVFDCALHVEDRSTFCTFSCIIVSVLSGPRVGSLEKVIAIPNVALHLILDRRLLHFRYHCSYLRSYVIHYDKRITRTVSLEFVYLAIILMFNSNNDVLAAVLRKFAPGDLLPFSWTCKAFHTFVLKLRKSLFEAENLLEPFFGPGNYSTFRGIQANPGAIILGSVALEFFWPEISGRSKSLDIGIESQRIYGLSKFLESVGYKSCGRRGFKEAHDSDVEGDPMDDIRYFSRFYEGTEYKIIMYMTCQTPFRMLLTSGLSEFVNILIISGFDAR